MIIKTGKQLMVKDYNNYNIVSGTVDNKNPKALYLNISAWGEPLIENDVNYKSVIRQLDKIVRNTLYKDLDSNLFQTKRSIVDFDMRESGIEFGKRSYMNCEITLFQNHNFKLQEKEIQDGLNDILKHITEGLNSTIYFEFHKGKK